MRVVAAAVVLTMLVLAGPATAQDAGWVPSLPPTGVSFYSVSLFDDGVGYVYNQQPEVPGSHLFRTTDGGVTYNRVSTTNAPGWVAAIKFASPSTAYSHTATDVTKSTDGATTFTALNLPQSEGESHSYHALAIGGPDVVAVGAHVDANPSCGEDTPRTTAVFTSTDGGNSWVTYRLADELRVRDLAVDGSGAGAMITHGMTTSTRPTDPPLGGAGCSFTFSHTGPGQVRLTDDGGESYRTVLDCGTGGCDQVARPAGDRVVVAMSDGSVRVSNDGGLSFSTLSLAPREPVSDEIWAHGLEFADADTGFLATATGIYRTDDGGLTWTEELSPQKTLGAGRGDLSVTESGAALVGGATGVLRRVPLG